LRHAKTPRPSKPLTPERLRAKLDWYVGRFAPNSARVRRTVRRWIARDGLESPDLDADLLIADEIARLTRLGFLDDARFAASKARAYARRALPLAEIRRRLMRDGVPDAQADAALAQLTEDEDAPRDPDLAAAIAFARRRRLGPYADPAARQDLRMRHLAALARRGFSSRIATTVIDHDGNPETLLEDEA